MQNVQHHYCVFPCSLPKLSTITNQYSMHCNVHSDIQPTGRTCLAQRYSLSIEAMSSAADLRIPFLVNMIGTLSGSICTVQGLVGYLWSCICSLASSCSIPTLYHSSSLRSAVSSRILLDLAGPMAITAATRRFPTTSFTLKVGKPAHSSHLKCIRVWKFSH